MIVQAKPVIVINKGDTLLPVPQDDIESVSGSTAGVTWNDDADIGLCHRGLCQVLRRHEDRIAEPGTTPIMAAFMHLNVEGNRFTNRSYGVFYASLTIETAIAETPYHRGRSLAATKEPGQELDMPVYAVDLDAELHDIRGLRESHPVCYHARSYATSQERAAQLRDYGSNGVAYLSVRHDGGERVAVFRPPLLSNCRQERHLCYVWDGQAVDHR